MALTLEALPADVAETFKNIYLETMPEVWKIGWEANLYYLDLMQEEGMIDEYFAIEDPSEWLSLASASWENLCEANPGLDVQIEAVQSLG